MFGVLFWDLKFGVWCLEIGVWDFEFVVLNLGFVFGGWSMQFWSLEIPVIGFGFGIWSLVLGLRSL